MKLFVAGICAMFLLILIQCGSSSPEIENEEQELPLSDEEILKNIFKGEISYDSLKNVSVDEGYKPNSPINFSHPVHVDIDCEECHKTVNNRPQLPTVEVCASCHYMKKSGKDKKTMTVEEYQNIFDDINSILESE